MEQAFLVTNYHVISGRDPRHPEMLEPGYPDSPDRIEYALLSKPEYEPRSGGFSITSGGEFAWIEHKKRSMGVDIVAVPVQFPEDAKVFTQRQLGLVEDIKIDIGSELFIVGFPYGYGAGDFFPIWKRGTIASEPLFEPEGLSRFYIDAFTKPGMSGSPVFAVELRDMFFFSGESKSKALSYQKGEISARDPFAHLDPEQLRKSTPVKHFQLVGIYSGKLTIEDKDPNIGIVWRKELIDELFFDPRVVKHPYPPVS